MPGRDYLLRQIEQLTSVLGTIFGLKREQKPQQAIQTIEEFLKREFGISFKLLKSLQIEELIRLCDADSLAGKDKLYTLAVLLKEEGELQRMTGNETAGDDSSLKSLHLMLTYAALSDHDLNLQTNESIKSLLQEDLQHLEIPIQTVHLLFQYYERNHQFADAENVLFDMLQRENQSAALVSQWIDEGSTFYKRLLELDDEQLQSGNLPRQEILDGLDELDHIRARET
jgi:Family of unknown function (DUF6483)